MIRQKNINPEQQIRCNARQGYDQWQQYSGGQLSATRLVAFGIEYEAQEQVSPLPAWKRLLDIGIIVASAPGLVLASLFAALVIKLGSKGPLLFCQERVGYKGKPFKIFKFRTMRAGAETKSHQNHVRELITSGKPMAKLDGKKDPRLIPFGAVLRATGLDELPQVINILKGEMSFVGPRPCVRYEYEAYEPRHRERLNAVPGLTGLWQVSGKNRTTFERMIELDVQYSRTLSLWQDLWIISKTFGALVTQCGDQIRARRQQPKAQPQAQMQPGRACEFQKS